ncbi:MAG: copper resistance system multicopper oxidase [Pseudomonadota bacterium]
MLNRRRFIAASVSAAAGLLLPPWARSGLRADLSGLVPVDGVMDLTVDHAMPRVEGRAAHAVLVNGQLPAPLLRWREGEDITLNVSNRLDEDTSIHWHGILLPFHMDGVPGVSFPGIRPGATFSYRFPVRQAGTYWYHSHSGLQEQQGHYGPLIIDPADADPVEFDRELVVVLSDWAFDHPHRIFARLKRMSDFYNRQQRTFQDFRRDVEELGLAGAAGELGMWHRMRMNPTDIADVTGSVYTYLINGHGPLDNWQGLFQPGERVRVRFINAAAMSIFNVRMPGLPMTVVQADGLAVKPVTVDEFQIGVAETFDVIVEPADRAYALVAESNDRSGAAFGTLAPHAGVVAERPALRPRPLLTMKDMGMDHSGHSGHGGHANHGGQNDREAKSADAHAGHKGHKGHKGHEGHKQQPAADEHQGHRGHHGGGSAQDRSPAEGQVAATADDGQASGGVRRGPGVVNVAENPVNRLHERPVGLEDVPHRVLVYTDLESLAPNPDKRAPQRELELHLTSNMERYMWSFDGRKFSEVREPIPFTLGERLRLTLVNDTMMPHPIHMHGMFFDVVTRPNAHHHHHKPRKHTIVVKPGEKLSVDITADAPGDWSFHCHLLYHMHAGMMRVVAIRPLA